MMSLPCWWHRCCSAWLLPRDASGETLDLGLPDRMMASLSVTFSHFGPSSWNMVWLEGPRGGVGSLRTCSAAGSRRRARDDGRAHGGGFVWCHGDIDGRPDEGLHFDLQPRDWKTATSETCVGGVTWSKCLVGLGSCLSKGRLGGLWIWPVRWRWIWTGL